MNLCIGAFKAAEECNDHVIMMDTIRALTINFKRISDFPFSIVIRNLKRLLSIPDTDFFICGQLSYCLNCIHSIDSKITRHLKLFYEELIKIKDPNKNINLMKLIVSIHVNN
ncbi:hypothetical protein MXB_3616 [Myxobolus squamalis]|nr:hypothetical protein MXB_3616 [Myxobolus squamalis]